jgi:hypothetical protein
VQLISLAELATEMGMDRSACRKLLVRHSIPTQRIRSIQSGGQTALAVTRENAELAKSLRIGTVTLDGVGLPGVFYTIQLVPEALPMRVKLGFTTSIEARLASHQAAAPTARVLKTWFSRPTWERAAIDSMTRVGVAAISTEIFDVSSLEELVERGDAFFAQMPPILPEELAAAVANVRSALGVLAPSTRRTKVREVASV